MGKKPYQCLLCGSLVSSNKHCFYLRGTVGLNVYLKGMMMNFKDTNQRRLQKRGEIQTLGQRAPGFGELSYEAPKMHTLQAMSPASFPQLLQAF